MPKAFPMVMADPIAMWTFSALLKPILLPPMSLFLVGFAGWLLRRRRPSLARFLMAGAAVGLYLVSTALVGGFLLRTLEHDPPLTAARFDDRVGVIVVLAADLRPRAPEYGGDSVGGLTLERLRYGAWLYRKTGKPLLTSGGQLHPGTRPLARIMSDILTSEFRVPVTWVEAKSRNTHENAVFSAAILRKAGVHRIYLVTHAWHMPRAREAFEAAGLKVVPAPLGFTPAPTFKYGDLVAGSGGLRRTAFAVHEWLGRLWYRLVYN